MITIKSILDEIAGESGTNAKVEILKKYQDNEVLKKVLYQANSKRVKFYIKQIPEFQYVGEDKGLDWALGEIKRLSSRDFTGGAASNHLQHVLGSLNLDDQYVIERIIDKDLKIGMGRTQINKVFKNLIEKTPYMGAKSFDKKYVEKILKSGKAISQIKMDGRYANAVISNGGLEFVSRAGEPNGIEDARFLKELVELGDDIVINGELTVLGVPVRRTANGIISSLIDIKSKEQERGPELTQKHIDKFLQKHRSDFNNDDLTFQEALDSVVYTCWDIITLDEYHEKKSKTPYHERFDKLRDIIEKSGATRIEVVETKLVSTPEEAMEHFLDALDRGLEGTILKAHEGAWKDGKPTWQVKMKLDMNIDLKIVGFEMGTPGTKNEKWVSTLNLESSCGLLKTNPSNMDEKMMEYVTENQDKLMGEIVEVNCKGLSQNKDGDWSTMHPSVVEIREGKQEFDSLESAKEIEEAAKNLENY